MPYIGLPDGRTLEYAAYGPESGHPLLLFHGTPRSRLDSPGTVDDLITHNIRLIIPNRPGYGRSDFQPERTLLDWPKDVMALADHLGLEAFHIVGYSGGGPYALACAREFPERLSGVALVSAPPPFASPDIREDMLPLGYDLYQLAATDLPLAVAQLQQLVPDPQVFCQMLAGSVAAVDKPFFDNQSFVTSLQDSLDQAFLQGMEGFALDGALLARPWGFDLCEVQAEIQLWHGEDDRSVPLSAGTYLAQQLPAARQQVVKNAGHFLLLSHGAEIQETLTRSV